MSEQIKTWIERAQEAGHYEVIRPSQSVGHMQAEIAELRAALAATQAPSAPVANYPEIPDGWQLVPKEPTAEMLKADLVRHVSDVFVNESMWRGLLAAAPAPPPSSLAQQVASAQAEVAKWPEGMLERVLPPARINPDPAQDPSLPRVHDGTPIYHK